MLYIFVICSYILKFVTVVNQIQQSIRTNAKLSNDGKHWILNGGKLWYVGLILFMMVYCIYVLVLIISYVLIFM